MFEFRDFKHYSSETKTSNNRTHKMKGKKTREIVFQNSFFATNVKILLPLGIATIDITLSKGKEKGKGRSELIC